MYLFFVNNNYWQIVSRFKLTFLIVIKNQPFIYFVRVETIFIIFLVQFTNVTMIMLAQILKFRVSKKIISFLNLLNRCHRFTFFQIHAQNILYIFMSTVNLEHISI